MYLDILILRHLQSGPCHGDELKRKVRATTSSCCTWTSSPTSAAELAGIDAPRRGGPTATPEPAR